MPIPFNKSPFLKDKYIPQESSRIVVRRKKKFEEPKRNFLPFEDKYLVPCYKAINEKKFYGLLSGRKEAAVVNFCEGNGFKTTIFHTYLKMLSCEHEEADFFYIDTGNCRELKNRLGIYCNPTIVVIVEGEIRDMVTGLNDFKAKIVVSMGALKARLASSGAIHHGGLIPQKPSDVDEEYIERVTKPKLLRLQRRLREEGSAGSVSE